MRAFRLFSTVAACIVSAAPQAVACWCFPVPLCAQVNGRSHSDAIFIGQVVDLWPSGTSAYLELERLSLEQLRTAVLKRWQGVLTPDEVHRIQTAIDRHEILLSYGMMQRVRFRVTERFGEARVDEVFTSLSSCGVRFDLGETYLVIGERSGRQYWSSACSRTARVQSNSAIADIEALRAWRSGAPAATRVYGWVDGWLDKVQVYGPDLRLRLFDAANQEEGVTQPDAKGWFRFEGLTRTKHRLVAEDSQGKADQTTIDLSPVACSEATVWSTNGKWNIKAAPKLMPLQREIQLLPDPPPVIPYIPERR